MSSTTPILRVEGLSKSFARKPALSDAGLELAAGEIRGLVGANGSGKSTLVKLLAGYHRPDDGSPPFLVDGVPVRPGPGDPIPGFRFVHQDLALIPDLTVAENLALDGTGSASLRPLQSRDEAREIRSTLAEYDLDFQPHTLVRELSAVDRTMLAVTRAFRGSDEEVRVLVLDEVTATLPPHETEVLFSMIRKLPAAGVIFVSHRIEEVLDHCDTVTALRDGRVVGDLATEELTPHELVHLITGAEPEEMYPDLPDPTSLKPMLQVRDLSGGTVRDVALDVHAGEIVGLASLDPRNGHDVLRLICGAMAAQSGEMELAGREIDNAGGPAATRKAGVTLVTDRLEAGIAGFSVRENLMLNGLEEFAHRGVLRLVPERLAARNLIQNYGVMPPGPEEPFATLSGGNQQKVMFAKSMRMKPKLLLLDDPTRGVDVGSKAVLYRIIRDAVDEGLAILISSTELDELAGLCHRVLVLREGLPNGFVGEDRLRPDHLLERCYLPVPAAGVTGGAA
jgi:ribose transport system ATP-binding protein